jgi:hypothetical protein
VYKEVKFPRQNSKGQFIEKIIDLRSEIYIFKVVIKKSKYSSNLLYFFLEFQEIIQNCLFL